MQKTSAMHLYQTCKLFHCMKLIAVLYFHTLICEANKQDNEIINGDAYHGAGMQHVFSGAKF